MPLDQTEHAIAEIHRLLKELDGAIDRQRKRVERLQVTVQGPRPWLGDASKRPAADEQAILAELLENRRIVQANLAELVAGQSPRRT
jgi:hypothetical protein